MTRNQKTSAIIFFVIALFTLSIVLTEYYATPQGFWACKNGEWVKYGKTRDSAPIGVCSSVSSTNSTVQPTATTTLPAVGIKIISPTPNQTVGRTFEARGAATGNWFFECSFPAKLVDENGKKYATAVAMAEGDCLTSDYVNFKVTFNLDQLLTSQKHLFIEFKNDNPSGDSFRDMTFKYPITFSSELNKK